MKLFLDRNKTLLPRVDIIFLLTRTLVFLLVCYFALFGDYEPEDQVLFIVVSTTYGLLLGLFFFGMRHKFDLKLAYLGTIIYDIVFLPLFVTFTGGPDSSFYLLFYLTISVAAYVLTLPFALTVTALLSGIYAFVMLPHVGMDDTLGFSVRVGFMWLAFLALFYVSDYMRKSERRLMKLFDTLNMRTSELEKSQALLEMIYENTRILAGMLDPDSVVREVMQIMNGTLQYKCCALVLRDESRGYFYRARMVNGTTSYNPKAMEVGKKDLIVRVVKGQEAVRLNDVAGRDDYQLLDKNTHSVILVPLTAHGRVSGLLVAEAVEASAFSSRDEQLLSVVARSAGLALENAELHKRTEELSIIDELTGAYNYRYFVQKFQEEKKRAVRYDLPLSVIMVDIDWFKKLNDSYGHEVGNIVLKSLAQTIKKCVRDVDIFSRYGGEEFVVILPQTPQAEAFHIGGRIREQVEKTLIDTGPAGKLKITVSVGVSSYPENGKSEEELVSIADQAMYQAKGSGKNLVCVS
jgi:diguanylate cyclase (GGDEF)-like protein